jgi:hypothetical protein
MSEMSIAAVNSVGTHIEDLGNSLRGRTTSGLRLRQLPEAFQSAATGPCVVRAGEGLGRDVVDRG